MITSNTTSGNIEVINSDNSCTAILTSFVGTITPLSSCVYLKLIVYGTCSVNSNIILSNHNKLDTIWVEGPETC